MASVGLAKCCDYGLSVSVRPATWNEISLVFAVSVWGVGGNVGVDENLRGEDRLTEARRVFTPQPSYREWVLQCTVRTVNLSKR